MHSTDLFVFLAAYTLTTFAVLVFESLQRRTWTNAIALLTALTALVATAVLGVYVEPGHSPSEVFLEIAREHRLRHMVAGVMGAAAAAAWVGRLVAMDLSRSIAGESGPRKTLAPRTSLGLQLIDQLILTASIAGVVGTGGLLLWNSLFDVAVKAGSRTKAFAPQFAIDEIAEISYLPVQVAVGDSGELYVNYFWAENNATHGGGIIKLTEDPDTGSFSQETVARSDVLFRALGLAVKDGDLYVSRSGYHAEATAGKLTYVDSGAVTQLKDLNGDGYFEYYHDILTGLPGGRGPDIQHQNNGLAFAPDGSLYVLNGFASLGLDEHPWGGALLKLSPDFEDVKVFTTGFRNPFGIVVTPDGEVFVTDNDVEENPGDELNHMIEGEHYGHPFVIPNQAGIDPVGFREPIFLGSLQANLVGMAYTDSPRLPDPFRDCFYIADLSSDEIIRVKLEPDGETFKVIAAEPFASIPSPLDVAIAKDGTIYVVARFERKIFRIRQRGSSETRRGAS